MKLLLPSHPEVSFLPYRKNASNTNTGSQVNSTNSTNSTSLREEGVELKCPFKDCVPWRTLILDSRNLSNSLNLDTIRIMFPHMGETASDCRLITPDADHVTAIYTVRMPRERDGMLCDDVCVTKLVSLNY